MADIVKKLFNSWSELACYYGSRCRDASPIMGGRGGEIITGTGNDLREFVERKYIAPKKMAQHREQERWPSLDELFCKTSLQHLKTTQCFEVKFEHLPNQTM
jgi:hypothetical protein